MFALPANLHNVCLVQLLDLFPNSSNPDISVFIEKDLVDINGPIKPSITVFSLQGSFKISSTDLAVSSVLGTVSLDFVLS